MLKTSLAIAALVCLAGSTAGAQVTISKATPVKSTATIQAIDTATRRITLRNEKGEVDTYIAGPEIQRFSELKVGDSVRTTYYESVVLQVRKPGDAPSPTSLEVASTPGTGALPSGTIAVQERRTVTVRTVDPSANSIVVTTDDGRNVMRKVENRSLFEHFKVGDKVDIIYTVALLASVERAN